MSITQATKKKLFAASGNECAFPDCDEEVVDIEEEIVIGVIAHIRARSPDGPRYDPDMTEEERNEFSNLMVLCPTHHTRIDKNPGKYPPEKLEEWKREHEKRATESIDIPEGLLGDIEDTGIDPEHELESWASEVSNLWEEKIEEQYGGINESPYQYGHWTFSYSIIDEFEEPGLSELQDILWDVKGNETGWPVWCGVNREAKPYDGEIEAWLVNHEIENPAHADFWHATPGGKLFLLRGYEEDARDGYTPGEVFDYIIPIWRVGECLLHASRLARKLSGDSTKVAFYIKWNKIDGRSLDSIYNRGGLWPPTDRQAYQESVSVSGTYSVSEIDRNLPEVVEELTKPLYEAFDFYEPPQTLIENQIDEMRN